MRKAVGYLLLLVTFAAWGIWISRPEAEPVVYRTDISELSSDPDWSELQQYHTRLTAGSFRHLLERYYTVGDAWKDELAFIDNAMYSLTTGDMLYTFPVETAFGVDAVSESIGNRRPYWRSKKEMGPRPVDRPLEGVRITLDPGHIGGKCAQMEERWFVIDDSLPVMEGEMVLLVAQKIKPRLEALGAVVSLTREENKPVGLKRSPHFMALAEAKVEALGLDKELTGKYAEKMFYRTAEIRARARKVNEVLKPDLVVALHFNAEAWGDPDNPTLTENNHFHILVNGAYTSGEVRKADQRFEMLRRILQGTFNEEVALSEAFVTSFWKETGLPAYQYEPNSTRALPVDTRGYVWSRNLLANRLFECPVVFLEPYIMNSQEVFDRVQAGDYEGTRKVAGRERKSIFNEYADAVVEGLKEYYQTN